MLYDRHFRRIEKRSEDESSQMKRKQRKSNEENNIGTKRNNK